MRLDGDDVGPAVATRLSPHQVGVADLLDGARWLDRYPARVVLLGLVPESIELGVGLSPRVRASLPSLVERSFDEAARAGFRLRTRRRRRDVLDRAESLDVARLAGMQ